jgi:hypothetical protein
MISQVYNIIDIIVKRNGAHFGDERTDGHGGDVRQGRS